MLHTGFGEASVALASFPSLIVRIVNAGDHFSDVHYGFHLMILFEAVSILLLVP